MKKTKTKAELRTEIARDVIKQINAEEIIAGGYYFSVDLKESYKGKQLQGILPEIKECVVCALGGMFYSYVKRHNNYEIDTDINDISCYSMRDAIDMFSDKQLQLIETAYEQSVFVDFGQYSQTAINKARDYRDKINMPFSKDDKEALIHIMKNIIKNKGLFKP